MKVSVVTPSYNMLDYLKRCHKSVADQRGVDVEHIVVDGLSTDGTKEFLESQASIHAIIERDQGMYDAVNKGLLTARGEIMSYLNCDEQYLPERCRLSITSSRRIPPWTCCSATHC